MDIDGAKSLVTPDSVATGDSVQDCPNVEDGGQGRGGVGPSEDGEKVAVGSSLLEAEGEYQKDRRRAKSLPVFTDQSTVFETICPETGRKRVQFADTLGLNLASVKHFSDSDDPQVPTIVFSRLQSFPPDVDRDISSDLCDIFTSALNLNYLVPAFEMPVDSKDFYSRVQRLRVSLEKVIVTQFDIRGMIRALTSGFSTKEVGVRYTFNNWRSFVDVQAVPTPGDCNAFEGEQFSFTLYTPPFLDADPSVHFAVYFRTDHGEFWDNNEGNNYSFWQQSS